MKRAPLKLAAMGDRIESSRLTWEIIIGGFVLGYAHFLSHWLSH